MHTRNRCYTYFKIVGNFNPDEVSALLNLIPEKSWKIGDLRRNGTKYDFALWGIGRCNEYDVEVEKLKSGGSGGYEWGCYPNIAVRGIGDMEKSISPIAFCGDLAVIHT